MGVAGVIRSFKKDYDSGYKHAELVRQLGILKKRVELARFMITVAATALLLACLSMFMIFGGWQEAGKVSFGASLLAMITSVILSLYETTLSNKSLIIEVDNMLADEKK